MHASEPTASRVAAIDLGGTNLQAAVVDQDYRILGRAHRRTGSEIGFDGVVGRLVDAVGEACAASGCEATDLEGVGVAAAGAIDFPRGVVLSSPNLEWRDAPLREAVAEAVGLPAVVENDVNAAAWGESQLGAGRGRGDVLAVWVGTGLGGGLVLGGRLHRGDFHTAGEIGHTVLFPNETAGRRSAEDWTSRTGMMRAIAHAADADDSPPGGPTARRGGGHFDELANAWRAGDGPAVAVIDRAASLLGVAIANWVTVLAMDTVVLGGGVTETLGEAYLDRVRASFDQHVFPDRSRACRIAMTELRENAGLLGASLLAREGKAMTDGR